MVHTRSALAKEARQASHTASRQASAVPASVISGGDAYPLHPDPAAAAFALEPLRRSLSSLPIAFLRAAAGRLSEILVEVETIIAKSDEQLMG